MRIAVIADTHDRLPPGVIERFSGADQLWHLGDVCSPVIIDLLMEAGLPIRVIRGNCDSCTEWPLTLDLEIEGFRIRLEHIPQDRPPAEFDLFLHGHTHVPRNEMVGSVRCLNPGSLGRANKGAPASFGWLELRRGEPAQWQIEPL